MIGDKISTERRYFISSLSGINAETIGQMIRSHWGVENKLPGIRLDLYAAISVWLSTLPPAVPPPVAAGRSLTYFAISS